MIHYNLLLNCYSTVVSEAKNKVKNGFKILTPKQMLPRLPLAFAQVKASTHLKTY